MEYNFSLPWKALWSPHGKSIISFGVCLSINKVQFLLNKGP